MDLSMTIFKYVWHFSYELDDDYTALYKGRPFEQLLTCSSNSIVIFSNLQSPSFSAWGFEKP